MKKLAIIFVVVFAISGTYYPQAMSVDSLEALVQQASGKEKADLLYKIAYFSKGEKKFQKAQEAYDYAEGKGYDTDRGKALGQTGQAYYFNKEYKKAIEVFRRSAEILAKAGDAKEESLAYHRIGNSYKKLAEHEKAKIYFQKAIELRNRSGLENENLYSYNMMGLLNWITAKYDSAIIYYLKTEELADKLGNEKMHSASLNNMGIIYWEWGLPDKALEYYNISLNKRREIGDKAGEVIVLNNIGLLYLETDDPEEAIRYFHNGLAESKKIEHSTYVGYSLTNIGNAYSKVEKYDSAFIYYNLSIKAYEEVGEPSGVLINKLVMGNVYNRMNETGNAQKVLKDAIYLSRELGAPAKEAIALKQLGISEVKNLRYSAAMNYFNRSLELAEKNDQRRLVMELNELIAKNYRATGKYDKALDHYLTYYTMQDSVQSKQSENKLLEYKTRLETERTKNNLAATELAMEKQKLFTIILISVVVILVLVVIVAIRYNFIKKRTNKLLEELNRTKDKFFSIMAHDIKNPLGTVIGYSELLVNDYNDLSEDERRQFAESIHASTLHLSGLLDNLLVWAKNQMGAIKTNKEELNLKEAVIESISLFEVAAQTKNVGVDLLIDEGLEVKADRFMLRTVVANLFNNAVKFSYPGNRITIEGYGENGNVKLHIKDEGVGMDNETRQKLFRLDKTNSTKGTGQETGSGLGLIISREFINRHGGKLEVKSEPGKGSVFTVDLPRE